MIIWKNIFEFELNFNIERIVLLSVQNFGFSVVLFGTNVRVVSLTSLVVFS